MTNARQAKRIFEPLLSRYDDLVQIGPRMLWLKPIHHLALRVFIESSSHADYPTPQWNIIELFFPNRIIKNALGHRNILFRSEIATNKSWIWSDPGTVDELIYSIEFEALPLLRSKQHFQTYAAYYYYQFARSGMFMNEEDCLLVDIALGDLENAQEKCRKLLPNYTEDKYPNWRLWQRLRTQVVTVAEPLMSGDKLALAKILHGWECTNIKGTMLEPFWERTPLPLEH